eukprot:11567900-Karenia_brevis.AAC.1
MLYPLGKGWAVAVHNTFLTVEWRGCAERRAHSAPAKMTALQSASAQPSQLVLDLPVALEVEEVDVEKQAEMEE